MHSAYESEECSSRKSQMTPAILKVCTVILLQFHLDSQHDVIDVGGVEFYNHIHKNKNKTKQSRIISCLTVFRRVFNTNEIFQFCCVRQSTISIYRQADVFIAVIKYQLVRKAHRTERIQKETVK